VIVPVAALAVLVQSQAAGVYDLDEATIRAATEVTRENPALYRALLVWQEAFQAKWVNIAVTLVCLWAWRRHGLRTRALWAFVTLIVTWNLGLVAKHLVARARPVVEDALTLAPGYSFPSGHATNTTAAGLILTVLVWPLLGRRGRTALVALVAAAVVLTGLDRVFLGAHYPSDVVAGIALGGAMAGASFLGYVGWHPPVPRHAHEEER
jgi:membrane-associated phospholipid phosphatase